MMGNIGCVICGAMGDVGYAGICRKCTAEGASAEKNPLRFAHAPENAATRFYRDSGISSFSIDQIRNEDQRQIAKWGIQSRTAFEWMTDIAEEVGETARAISEHEYRGGNPGEVVAEAIQAATLLLKIAEIFHRIDASALKAKPETP